MQPPSARLTDAVSHLASVYIPAGREVVDRFGSSVLAPVRPTIAPCRMLRCARTSDCLPLPLRHWLCSIRRRMLERPCGTPCHTVRRSESWAIPSLCRATPSATSEHFLGLIDSRQSLRLRRFLRFLSTEAPLLDRHYPASALIPASPSPQTAQPDSHELPVDPNCDHRWGFPCCYWSTLHACRRHYPGRSNGTRSLVLSHQRRPSR